MRRKACSNGAKAINDRIAIATYLNETRNEPQSSRCMEMVDFIADSSRTTLLVQDRACNLQHGLMHFCRQLTLRENLFKIVLDNVALTDECMDVLASILVHNASVRQLIIARNLITSNGAKKLAEALELLTDSSHSIELIDMSDNSIGDDGVQALASALISNPKLNTIRLGRNRI